MEFDNSKPIYLQIIDDIKKQLIRGELRPGDKILSQREFAQKVKVNPNTVQRAYREMENMNLVETIRGQGTFVYSREGMMDEIKEEMASRVLKSFLDEMYSLGFDNKKIIELVEKCQQRLEEDKS